MLEFILKILKLTYSIYTVTTNDFKLNLIAQRIFLEERLCLPYNKMESFIIVAFSIVYSQMFYSDEKENILTSFDLYKILYFRGF